MTFSDGRLTSKNQRMRAIRFLVPAFCYVFLAVAVYTDELHFQAESIPGCKSEIMISLPSNYYPARVDSQKIIEDTINEQSNRRLQKGSWQRKLYSDDWSSRPDFQYVSVFLTPIADFADEKEERGNWNEYRVLVLRHENSKVLTVTKLLKRVGLSKRQADSLLSLNTKNPDRLFAVFESNDSGTVIVSAFKSMYTDSCGAVSMGYFIPISNKEKMKDFLLQSEIK